AAVRADLCILRAQVALLHGDGPRALVEVDRIDAAARDGDALVDVRALCIEASARLATLPADPRAAARLAVRAPRKAGASALAEGRLQALEVLFAARRARRPHLPRAPEPPPPAARAHPRPSAPPAPCP